MNREALDAWFANADDILADWEPSMDAMIASVSDDGADLPLADSYYDQDLNPEQLRILSDAATRFARDVQPLVTAFQRMAEQFAAIRLSLAPLPHVEKHTDWRAHALEARRNRNTGPVARRGIDGFHR